MTRIRRPIRRPSKPAGAPSPKSSRGIALIAVLWVVLLLSVIGGSLTMLTRAHLDVSRNLVLSAKAETLAEGGVYLALDELLSSGSQLRAHADGHAREVALDSGKLDISVMDVAGRIDLNAAPPELIAGLLRVGGASAETADKLADRIADWRDADNTPRPNGAEQSDYAGSEPPVHVSNGPFLTAEEVMRVPGMTLDLWSAIGDSLTVASRRPGVNPMFASRKTLLALPGMDEGTADAILKARDGGSMADLANLVPAESRLYLTGGPSNIFAVRVRVQIEQGAVYVLDALVEPTPMAKPPWRIHAWRPGEIGAPAKASDKNPPAVPAS